MTFHLRLSFHPLILFSNSLHTEHAVFFPLYTLWLRLSASVSFHPLEVSVCVCPPPPVYDTLSPLPPPEVLKHAEGKFSHFQSLYFFLRTLMKWQQHLPACVLVFMRLHWCTKKCVCVCVACVYVYVSACTSAGE